MSPTNCCGRALWFSPRGGMLQAEVPQRGVSVEEVSDKASFSVIKASVSRRKQGFLFFCPYVENADQFSRDADDARAAHSVSRRRPNLDGPSSEIRVRPPTCLASAFCVTTTGVTETVFWTGSGSGVWSCCQPLHRATMLCGAMRSVSETTSEKSGRRSWRSSGSPHALLF